MPVTTRAKVATAAAAAKRSKKIPEMTRTKSAALTPKPTRRRMKQLAMGPRVSKNSYVSTTAADRLTTEPNLVPCLDRLPAEIVACICDFLTVPYTDSLLHLRATCRDLAAKTLVYFGKSYFTSQNWSLSRTGSAQFHAMGKNRNVTPYITTLRLTTLCPYHRHNNYLLAKGYTGTSLGLACSSMPNLHSLDMSNFRFSKSCHFFEEFARALEVPKLAHLTMLACILEDIDLALMIRKHKACIHYFKLDEINLSGGMNDIVRYMIKKGKPKAWVDNFRTPWSIVFKAMLECEDQCTVYLEMPLQYRREVDPLSPEPFEYFSYLGLEIEFEPNNEVAHLEADYFELDDIHQSISITRDENWREGVKRLDQMYRYTIKDPERDGTPPWTD